MIDTTRDILYRIQNTMYRMQYTMNRIQYTMNRIQYTAVLYLFISLINKLHPEVWSINTALIGPYLYLADYILYIDFVLFHLRYFLDQVHRNKVYCCYLSGS